jgi:hypothetical protein
MIEKVTSIILNPTDYIKSPLVVIEGELKVRGSTRKT